MDENAFPPGNPPPSPPVPPTVPPVSSPPPAASVPPVITPAATRPVRRGRGWMVVAIVLFVLLAVSVLYNIGSFFSGVFRATGPRYYTSTGGPRLDEVVREDNGAANKIAVIEVNGVIMDGAFEQNGYGMVDVIRAQLKQAEEDSRVRAVILRVDSPGGEVLASDDINRAITEFQSNTRKPVIASMGTLAASGGYYISVPCRWIVANQLTITGSIGVIMSSWNYRGLMDKVGVRPMVFKSGKYKDMLSGSREPESITPEERDMVQNLVMETYSRFTNVVREGRSQAFEKNQRNKDQGRELIAGWTDYADGRVLSGTEAFKLGFVDELGGFKDAVTRAKKLAGVSEANLIQYQQRHELGDLFRMFGKTDAKTLKIDLGMDLPKLQAGRLYFLSSSVVQ